MAIAKDHAGEMEGAIDYRDFVSNKTPTIIQIGAHDGIVGEEYGLQEFLESIQSFNLILVEPILKYFNNLKLVYSNYGDSVTYCNHAISETNENVYMKEQGCMSFVSNFGNICVKSKTWEQFISDNNVKLIDLLLLDCEGYEFNIIKQINFKKNKPKVIRYEYMHIANKEECDNFLINNGYKINYCKFDHTYNKVAIL